VYSSKITCWQVTEKKFIGGNYSRKNGKLCNAQYFEIIRVKDHGTFTKVYEYLCQNAWA